MLSSAAAPPGLPDPPGAAPSVDDPPRGTGRPREQRIDAAVLAATVDLLAEVGYARLTMAGVAARAGVHKPAIYRRWPSKAILVHEAVFPDEVGLLAPDTGHLRRDLTVLVQGAVELFGRPAVRAAVPGLLAEFAADPELHAQLLERLSVHVWGAMADRLAAATERGEVRPGIDPAVVLELVGGAALMALLVRSPATIDEHWIDATVSVLLEGIAR